VAGCCCVSTGCHACLPAVGATGGATHAWTAPLTTTASYGQCTPHHGTQQGGSVLVLVLSEHSGNRPSRWYCCVDVCACVWPVHFTVRARLTYSIQHSMAWCMLHSTAHATRPRYHATWRMQHDEGIMHQHATFAVQHGTASSTAHTTALHTPYTRLMHVSPAPHCPLLSACCPLSSCIPPCCPPPPRRSLLTAGCSCCRRPAMLCVLWCACMDTTASKPSTGVWACVTRVCERWWQWQWRYLWCAYQT
jgi:hypothetical protein